MPPGSGPTQTLALRLCEQANPQSVAISEASTRLIREDFPWQPLTSLATTGSAQQLTCYQVTPEHRHLLEQFVRPYQDETPFVGREPELALLQHYWAEAQQGMGKTVWIRGDPGMGKSRLLACFQDRIAQTSYRHLICHSSPYHRNSAWFPVLEQLRAQLQQQAVDSSAGGPECLEILAGQAGLKRF